MFYAHGSCSDQDIAEGFFLTKITALGYIYIEAKIGQQPTTDKQDFIYALGFEVLSLCNEAWHMLHAA